MRPRVVTPVAAVAVACFVVLAGCSSSGGSSSATGSSSAAGSSKLTGAPINVMLSTTLSGINSPYPETEGGVKAAIAEVNDSGGIDGHPIDLTVCDSQGNPNIQQSCAQQAVADKDVAVFAPANVLTTSLIPTLQKAGIPLIGADTNTSLDATSPISFPAVTGGYDLGNAVGVVSKKIGCRKVASVIIQAPDITTVIASNFQHAITDAGIAYAGPTYSPVSQTNFTDTLAAVEQTGADCVVLAIAVAQTTGFLTAWKQSGSTLKVINPGTTLASLNTISSIATGIYVYSPVRLPTDPEVAGVVADINKYAPGTSITARAIESYAIVQLFATALKNAKPATYTAQTVLAAMGKLQNATTGNVLPPYTTTTTNPVPDQERIFNHEIVIYKVDGTNTQTISNFIPIPGITSPMK
jgi:branched-chain amino acid transport system substrate-binding protein